VSTINEHHSYTGTQVSNKLFGDVYFIDVYLSIIIILDLHETDSVFSCLSVKEQFHINSVVWNYWPLQQSYRLTLQIFIPLVHSSGCIIDRVHHYQLQIQRGTRDWPYSVIEEHDGKCRQGCQHL
jgi:hypothetical protein